MAAGVQTPCSWQIREDPCPRTRSGPRADQVAVHRRQRTRFYAASAILVLQWSSSFPLVWAVVEAEAAAAGMWACGYEPFVPYPDRTNATWPSLCMTCGNLAHALSAVIDYQPTSSLDGPSPSPRPTPWATLYPGPMTTRRSRKASTAPKPCFSSRDAGPMPSPRCSATAPNPLQRTSPGSRWAPEMSECRIVDSYVQLGRLNVDRA
jgi:hypothetical protein